VFSPSQRRTGTNCDARRFFDKRLKIERASDGLNDGLDPPAVDAPDALGAPGEAPRLDCAAPLTARVRRARGADLSSIATLDREVSPVYNGAGAYRRFLEPDRVGGERHRPVEVGGAEPAVAYVDDLDHPVRTV